MIKIDRIKVSNFKNILSADLEMSKFNLIVGANNSGKSNFLKIFQLLDLIINGSTDEVKNFFEEGGSSILGLIKPYHFLKNCETCIELKFTDTISKTVFNYELIIETVPTNRFLQTPVRINQESLTFKSSVKTGKPISVFSRIRNNVNFGNEFSKTQILEEVQDHISVVRLINLIQEKNNPYKEAFNLLNYIVKTPVFYFSNIELNNYDVKEKKDAYGRTVSFNVIDEIIKLENTPSFSILTSILQTILKIDNVEIFPIINSTGIEDHKIVLFTQFNKLKDIKDFSDGSILLVSLVIKILSSNHSIFLIEEPENSLHPKALIELLNFMRSYLEEKQFIIATHSLALLNTTDPKDVIIANVNEKGESTFSNVSDQKDILKKLKSGFMEFSDYIFFGDTAEEEIE
jgi:predicted ATP-dependent endonuclease of OLD family